MKETFLANRIATLERALNDNQYSSNPRVKWHRMLDEAMNETKEGDFFLPQFVRLVLRDAKANDQAQRRAPREKVEREETDQETKASRACQAGRTFAGARC